MKKKIVKTLAVTTALTIAAASMVGCGNSGTADSNADNKASGDTQAAASDSKDAKDITGTVTMAGSTSMEKLANSLKEAFGAKYPGISVTAEFTGSSAGIESLEAGSVDIGNSSRELSDDEKSQGIVENVVAIDGIAVITDTANDVTKISSDDLAKVYTGEITNWKELGGQDEAIVVVGREAASGTRGAFEELLDIKDKCKYANELDSTGAVLAKVASTPGSIGYISLDVLDDSVSALAIDDGEATEDNIVAGKYKLSRPFVMATKGEISEQSEAVQTFFDYIQSDEGQEVIKKAGLILPQ